MANDIDISKVKWDAPAIDPKQVKWDTPTSVQSQPTDTVPKWGEKHPNLYGLYGAGRALARTGIETGGQALGALGGGALGTLAVPGAGTVAGGIAGAGAGYAGGRQLADLVLGENEAKNTLGGVAKDFAFGGATQGLGALVAKGMTKALPQSAIDKMYASSLKLSTSPSVLPIAERNAIIKTGLREKAVPNVKGYERILEKIDGFNSDVENLIATGGRNGETISAQEVVKRLDSLVGKGGRLEKVDPGFLGKINEVKRAFLRGGNDIPIEQAQEMKRHIYKIAKDFYGMDDAKAAEIAGKKAIARGLKEEMEALHPEIKELNMKESELLKFLDPFGRATARIQNRDIIGLGMQMAPMTTAALTGGSSAAAKAGFVAKLVDTPSIKARMAILLNQAKRRGPGPLRKVAGKVIPTAAIARRNYLSPAESEALTLDSDPIY